MKIIDFEKKGNVVRFFLGGDPEFTGDDWDDSPYYCNAGQVYNEYIKGYRDIAFPFGLAVLEPKDPEGRECIWCKDDMKARKVPCIVVAPEDDWWHDGEFDYYLASDQAIKFYFGDPMEPSDKLEVWKI